MNVNCKPRGMHRQCNFLSVSFTKPFKPPLLPLLLRYQLYTCLVESIPEVTFVPKMRFLQKEKSFTVYFRKNIRFQES